MCFWGQDEGIFGEKNITLRFKIISVMRVLLVNTSERVGGAAIAASRLLRALNRNGVEATMLVRDKQTDNPRVCALPESPMLKAKFVAERADIFVRNGLTKQNLFNIDTGRFGTDITRLPEFQRADVIHLHWVNQAMLSLQGLERILRTGKRVVWTMHDMWPFTGVCHHAEECRGWTTGCGNCPLLNRKGAHDMSWQTFKKKAEVYGRHALTFVGCSNWLTDLARQAPLLKGQRVESIPNPIDSAMFCPGDKREARQRLGLPQDRLLMLFVAYKATNPKKGIDYLRDAVGRMVAADAALRDKAGVVVVGREAETLRDTFDLPLYPTEYVSDTATMLDFYRAADVLVMPTLMDNLPNTIVEAMACGVPVVGFNVGGLPQMIDHGENGWLAPEKDSEALAERLHATLTDGRLPQMGEAARHKAVKSYSEQAVAERFMQIYGP